MLNTLTSEASRLGTRVTEGASDVARQGAQWARDGSERVLLEASRASGRARGVVREQPVRSMLVAAAAGALLYAVVRALASRPRW